MGKSTKIETDRRIFTVQSWIIGGVPDYLILRQAQDQFSVGERQAKNYLAKAYEIWKSASEATVEQMRQTQIDKMQQAQRTLKDNFKGTPAGLRVLLQYEKEINKLKGVVPAKEHIHKGDPENPVIVNQTDSIEERIAALLKKGIDKGDNRIIDLVSKFVK